MKRQLLVAGLVVAAILVVIENWIYFQKASESSRPRGVRQGEQVASTEEVEETSGSNARASDGPPAPVSRARLYGILQAVDFERSPFLLGHEQFGGVLTESSGLPQLAGTLIGAGRRIAWIDGRPRREGEYLGEFLVSEIKAEHVVLEREGRRYPLGLNVSTLDPEKSSDPNAPEETPDAAVAEGTE